MIRYWFRGMVGFRWVCGWTFGETLEQASKGAIQQANRDGAKGKAKLFFQPDADDGTAGEVLTWEGVIA